MIRALLAAAAMLLSAPALANPTPAGDPDVFVELGYTPFATDYFAPGSHTQGGNSATIALTPSPTISLTSQGRALYPEPASGRALARVTYDYVLLLEQISNAPSRIDGMVDLTGNYALNIQSTTPEGFASVRVATATDRNLFFSQPDGQSFNRSLYANGDSGTYALKGPGQLVDANYSYNGANWLLYRGSIQLSASLTPGANPASAMIDPVVSVNQAALQASGFQSQLILLLSSGVGNSAAGAVPEPGQWFLLIGGFAVMGAAVRRRRTVLA